MDKYNDDEGIGLELEKNEAEEDEEEEEEGKVVHKSFMRKYKAWFIVLGIVVLLGVGSLVYYYNYTISQSRTNYGFAVTDIQNSEFTSAAAYLNKISPWDKLDYQKAQKFLVTVTEAEGVQKVAGFLVTSLSSYETAEDNFATDFSNAADGTNEAINSNDGFGDYNQNYVAYSQRCLNLASNDIHSMQAGILLMNVVVGEIKSSSVLSGYDTTNLLASLNGSSLGASEATNDLSEANNAMQSMNGFGVSGYIDDENTSTASLSSSNTAVNSDSSSLEGYMVGVVKNIKANIEE